MNDVINYMGISSLMIILEQERKHWLMHTWKKNTVQDKQTGETFIGVVDNKGSHIDLESTKLGKQYTILGTAQFTDNEMNNVLTTDVSPFPYTNGMDGALIQRIVSSQYVVSSDTRPHYSIKFTDCTEVTIPFSGSNTSSDVYPFRWIKTTTVPTMVLGNGVEKPCNMDGVTNCVYYYPLDESLQPLPLTNPSAGTYTTAMVSSDAYIGYPIYWYTCDEFKEVNRIESDVEGYFIPGNVATTTKNNVNIYTGFKTPGNLPLSSYKIIVTGTFSNDNTDFSKSLDKTIKLVNNNTSAITNVVLDSDTDFVLTMVRDIGWTFLNSSSYQIQMSTFDNDGTSPLIPCLNANVHITNVTNVDTTDSGSTGLYMYADLSQNTDNEYVNGLFEFDGLPTYLDENKKETVVMYAVHNTPDAASPTDKQTAAIILDPGIIQNEDPEDPTSDTYMNGRAYVISNDKIEYENNATADHPKPARTVARMCDIPTSVVQLTNITGIAPSPVVDKKYVRNECSYTEDDKDRLYNTLTTRWVRPVHVNSNGVPIKDTGLNEDDNQFVFRNFDALKAVDLVNHNDFRYLDQLNPTVDPDDVSINAITDRGTGYASNDYGKIYIGGFGFTYIVTEVDSSGAVLSASLSADDEDPINLSNFDMSEGMSGITASYGTSPETGDGTGLRMSFIIANYADILTKPAEIFTDLFALCCDESGLWLYSYNINQQSTNHPKLGFWEKVIKISEYEDSEINTSRGNISISEAYINSVLPTNHEIPVSLSTQYNPPINIDAITTTSFINIVDKHHSPLTNGSNSIDMNKFVSIERPHTIRASQKTFENILYVLRQSNALTFDSYLLWRWENPSDSTNTKFEYCILRRSFNNYVSTDNISLLPDNGLRYKKFVHTNNGTTVTWNIDLVGNMVWVYNPSSVINEKYSLDEVGQLSIDYKKSSWRDVEILNGDMNSVVDENGNLLWNIATNNPSQVNYTPSGTDPIYQQPDYVNLNDCVVGANVDNIIQNHCPMGSWSLVYPRTHSFTVKSNSLDTNINLVPMHIIRTNNMAQNAQIKDDNGNNINDYTVTLDQSSSGLSFKAFDKRTGTWISI